MPGAFTGARVSEQAQDIIVLAMLALLGMGDQHHSPRECWTQRCSYFFQYLRPGAGTHSATWPRALPAARWLSRGTPAHALL
jgi:hypothetical protein